MKRIIIILAVVILPFSCQKEKVNIDDINGTMDLKGVSLSQLKAFLHGKWRWQYSVIHNFGGFKDTVRLLELRDYITFTSKDSVIQTSETSSYSNREKLIYEHVKIPGDPNGTMAYLLKFNDDGFGYFYNWVADRLVNDTLVFVDYFRSEGFNSYHFTKE